MREIVLPAGTVPGSPEAVAHIAAQLPPVYDESLSEPAPEAVVAAGAEAYDLIVAGLEMMLDGFKELRNE
jgi:hypothetical protein